MPGPLFVIEAPGKIQSFEAVLLEAGFPAVVQATKGHLYSMPKRLTPVGIDSGFREFERRPIDPIVIEWLRRKAGDADRVYVATDADQEGDVIAWDVAETIRDLHPECLRVKLRGMDRESVLEAIGQAGPVRRKDAAAGRTRAIVDRLIGAGFSKDGVAVGRVGTALLGLVRRDAPSVVRLHLSAPASDRGRPFHAECTTGGALTEAVARRLSDLSLPALDLRAREKTNLPPKHTGDIMVAAGDKLGIPPGEAAKSMQRLYESGKMSYPRSGSRAISGATATKLAKIFTQAGYRCVDGKWVRKGEGDVHDAPHPIGKVEATADPKKLGSDEGIRVMVARDLMRGGLDRSKELPELAPVVRFLKEQGFESEVVAKIASLDWYREVGPKFPGENPWAKSEIEIRRPDTVLLEHACAADLGRPSTWANHVENFMGRGLVDENLGLTRKGQEWISRSPPALLDPRISAAIEKACETYPAQLDDHPDMEPWELNAARIVKALPPEIRGTVTGLVENEPLHAPFDRVSDFIRDHAPTIPDAALRDDLAAALKTAKPVPKFAPGG